jgi:hypothetical protein
MLLKPEPGGHVRALAEISPDADPTALRHALEAAGADIRTWSVETHLVSIEIPITRLVELNGIGAVVYVEAVDQYTL